MSIGGWVILWIACAIILPPLIRKLGLNRSHREDARLPPGELASQLKKRFADAFEYLAWVAGTLGILYQAHRDTPMLAVLTWSLGYVIVIAIVAILGSLLPRHPIRNGYHIVLMIVGGIGLLTFYSDRSASREADEARAAAVGELRAIEIRLKSEWLADLRAAGAHGAAG